MPKLPGSGLPGAPVSDQAGALFRTFAAAKPPAGAFAVVLALLLSGCTGDAGDAPTGSIMGTGTGTEIATGTGTATPPEIVARLDLQLDIPWAAVFLPNGTAVISERDSALLKAVRDGKATTIGQVPGVAPGSEGGLLGLALSPDFPADSYLYLYFTSAQDNRIARLKLTEQPDGVLDLGDPMPCKAWGTETSKDWRGTALAGSGPASTARTSTTSSTSSRREPTTGGPK